MRKLSTAQVAKRLGIGKSSLSRFIIAGKLPAPDETMAGGIRLRLWSEEDVARLREVLPKIKNGRKTRYQKLRQLALGNQQSAKAKSKPKPSSRRRKAGGSKDPASSSSRAK